MQSKLGSFIETIVNILIGFTIAVISQSFIFPMYGIYIPLSTNIYITMWFTLVSVVRSYIIRRWFNYRLMKKYNK